MMNPNLRVPYNNGWRRWPQSVRVGRPSDYVISMYIPSEKVTFCVGDLDYGDKVLWLLEQVLEEDREIVESMQFHQGGDYSIILDFVGTDRNEAKMRLAEWIMSQFICTETKPVSHLIHAATTMGVHITEGSDLPSVGSQVRDDNFYEGEGVVHRTQAERTHQSTGNDTEDMLRLMKNINGEINKTNQDKDIEDLPF